MECKKCKAQIPDGSRFCNMCGFPLSVEKKTKQRGNCTGTVFKRTGAKTWTAEITVSYYAGKDGKMQRRSRAKAGFATKKDDMNYLAELRNAPAQKVKPITFRKAYELWLPTHSAGKSTIDCYKAAIRYFEPVYDLNICDITIDDLQDCVDNCDKGKRTKENMRAVCGLIYKYAIPRHMLYDNLNMAQFLKVSGTSIHKDGLPLEYLEKLSANVGKVWGAELILCHCYLGFRPSEFVSLDAKNYNRKEKAFTGGSKTDAGKDRIVTVSPKIQPYIDAMTANRISGQVVRDADDKPMSAVVYRDLFYSILEDCGLENPIVVRDGQEFHTYTPHSCRHTFATLMKRVAGADKDKLELIGHTSTEMLRYYQDVNYDDLRKITEAI